MEQPTSSIKLRALDPELPMLAAQAAMELDNYKSSGEIDFAAVKKLSLRLNNSFQSGVSAAEPRKALLDSGTVSLLGHAFNSSSRTDKISTIDQLSKELWDVAQRLEKVEAAPAEQPIEKIRDFCVALSECAASYRQTFHDLRPAHPFRR
jgi:hypothetical protein